MDEMEKQFGEDNWKKFSINHINIHTKNTEENISGGKKCVLALNETGIKLYRSLERDHNNQITARITILIAFAGVIVSFISLYLIFNPLPDRPRLELFTTKDAFSTKVFIHNAGKAPCVGLRLTFPDSVISAQQIVGYKESRIQKAQLIKVNETGDWVLGFPPMSLVPINKYCSAHMCQYALGYIEAGEIIPLIFELSSQKKELIQVTCLNEEETIFLE